MGRYITWADIAARYPEIAKVGGSVEVGSAHIPFAEAEVDGLLAGVYTTPFSSNNLTARDLSIDVAYLRSNALRDPDRVQPIVDRVDRMITDLRSGRMSMVTASGDTLYGSGAPGATMWSTTMGYHPVFGADETEMFTVDSAQILDEENAR